MMDKLRSYQQGLKITNDNSDETTPIFPSRTIRNTTDALDTNDIATAGNQVVHETVHKIKSLQQSSPFSFRVLGLVGGLAMIASNALQIPGRLLTLHFTRAILSFYCLLFGVMIVVLEVSGSDENNYGQQLQQGIRFYAKFLEYTWGRGLLYFFVGTLQAANWNWLDWIVGGFMMFVGITACLAGMKTAHDLRRLRVTIRDEADLKAKWNKYATNGSGYLTNKELTLFISDAGIQMSTNEVVSAYMALNRKLDDQLTYEELLDWWSRPASGPLGLERLTV